MELAADSYMVRPPRTATDYASLASQELEGVQFYELDSVAKEVKC